MCPFTDITRGSAEKATEEGGRQIGFDVHLENLQRKGGWTYCFLIKIHTRLMICAKSNRTRKPRSLEKKATGNKVSVMLNKSGDGDVREVGEPIRRLVDVGSVDRIGKFCTPMHEYVYLRKMVYEGTNY